MIIELIEIDYINCPRNLQTVHFSGAERFQSVVGAEDLAVESVRFNHPWKNACHYDVCLFLVLLKHILVLFHPIF